MSAPSLYWLPVASNWRNRIATLRGAPQPSWDEAVALANTQLDFVRTNALDQVFRLRLANSPPDRRIQQVRLAILGSSTLAHVHAAIRVGALRRGMSVVTYENTYGQYFQELTDQSSDLHRFRPTAILLALDADHLTAGMDASMTTADADIAFSEICKKIEHCWSLARRAFGCEILQQTPLPVSPALMGSNEHRLPGSRHNMILRLNVSLRDMADRANVDILAVDSKAATDGIWAWHDQALWHRSKQEIKPSASPVYGDMVARILAARQGRSAKCLVLDLDNTLWGGVIGDDGIDNIILGEGSPQGEGFKAIQSYAKDLARRGVILAVCSKNDEANAIEPFDKHPEMVLRRTDIASFVANWNDKATNIRAIAEELNIGLDSIVFVDDNPFERDLVRGELPMVMVPEFPDEPAAVPQCLADAGYFESLFITDEDRERSLQYQSNRSRKALFDSATDMPSYLRGLEMKLVWTRFDLLSLQRTAQLINKTNQFNLTTKRYTEENIREVMASKQMLGLQFRLVDRFGDNGIIGIIIGKMTTENDLIIDTWLMSCRVLGRGVESAMLDVLALQAGQLGAVSLVGEYRPTKKNGMVRAHYSNLGFKTVELHEDGASRAVLSLEDLKSLAAFIEIEEG